LDLGSAAGQEAYPELLRTRLRRLIGRRFGSLLMVRHQPLKSSRRGLSSSSLIRIDGNRVFALELAF